MAELFLICMIVALVVLTIRSGRPVILDTPVIISRPGKYHITLAPQLNRAQNFIEQVATQLANLQPPITASHSVFFSVHDTRVCTTGAQCYLLAVSARGGLWYFQAILPQPLLHDRDSHYKTVSEFTAVVLHDLPEGEVCDADIAIIGGAVMAAAEWVKIPVFTLRQSS